MNLKHNPWSENFENQNSDLEQKKQEFEKLSDFKKISDANNKLYAGKESRTQLTHLQEDILKNEIKDQDNKTNNSYIDKYVSQQHLDSKEWEYTIENSGMSLKYENSLKWSIIGVWHTCMAWIQAVIEISKWIIQTPRDIYDFIVWNASYDWFKNI